MQPFFFPGLYLLSFPHACIAHGLPSSVYTVFFDRSQDFPQGLSFFGFQFVRQTFPIYREAFHYVQGIRSIDYAVVSELGIEGHRRFDVDALVKWLSLIHIWLLSSGDLEFFEFN